MAYEELQAKLKGLLDRLDRSDWERLRSVTKRGLVQLLPGGPLFDAWMSGLKDTKELETSLVLIISCLQEISQTKASDAEFKRFQATILAYLTTFERIFIEHLDSANALHDNILALFCQIVPPPKVVSPTIFLFSGPSASGKDALLHAVRKSLRARGYTCEYLLKYTTRGPRPSETEHDQTNYYQYLSEESFTKKLGEGEIILQYSKYGYQYGISLAQLRQDSMKKIPTLGIISDFREVQSSINELRKYGLRVVSTLIYAPAEDCRRRMRHRNLDPAEAQRRIIELEDDCKYIEAKKKLITNTYNFWLDNDDNIAFNTASITLYKWIEGSLRCDAE